jgi:very-short-patch-repair endonuclease
MTRGIGDPFLTAHEAKAWAESVLVGAPEDSVVVGLSAAAMWSMPLPPAVAQVLRRGRVSVSRRGAATPTRRSKVDGHSIDLPTSHCRVHASMVLTTPARTWVDCAALLPPDHLLAMGDMAMDTGLLTSEELASVVAWARTRRGVVRARKVLPWIRTGVESAQESRLRWHIVANEFPEPDINPEVVLPGSRVVRLDLAYRGLRIGVEFDGEWHIDTQAHDAERRRQLELAGWKVLVATKEDLADPTSFLAELRAEISLRTFVSKHRW